MSTLKHHLTYFIAFLGVMTPTNAYANAGVPMLYLLWPPLLVLLIPIIFIEALILSRQFVITFKKALNLSLWSNLTSTLIGITLTWMILLFIEYFMTSGGVLSTNLNTWHGKLIAGVLQAPWLPPHEDQLHWLFPIATTILILFFFLSSWTIEAGIVKLLFRQKPVRWPVFWANIASYLFVIIIAAVIIIVGPMPGSISGVFRDLVIKPISLLIESVISFAQVILKFFPKLS